MFESVDGRTDGLTDDGSICELKSQAVQTSELNLKLYEEKSKLISGSNMFTCIL